MSVTIEKGIPVPARRGGSEHRTVYSENALMDVGDSFLFPATISPSACYANAREWTRRLAPKQFITRKTADGMRIWRIA